MTVEVAAPKGPFRVLSVEDEPDTVAAFVGALRDEGVEVRPVEELGEARNVVEREKFDLLLVDARMPDGGRFLYSGGLDFIRQLKRSAFGSLNVHCEFAVVTAYLHEVDQVQLEQLEGFVGVFNKTIPNLGPLEDRLGHRIRKAPETVRKDFYEAEDLVIVRGMPSEHDELEVFVPGWADAEAVIVKYSGLPIEIRQELEFGDRPVYLWATVNIGATAAKDVQPGRFRLYDEDPQSEREFEQPSDASNGAVQ